VEEDDSGSDDDSTTDEHRYGQQIGGAASSISRGWDEEEDEDWNGEGDEDTTIRIATEHMHIGEGSDAVHESEAWATDIRRSVERTRQPSKGILKHAGTYSQANYLPEPNRVRSNSYTADGEHPSQVGPLAQLPPSDPGHIDGLDNKHPTLSVIPSLPALSFDTSFDLDSPLQLEMPMTPEPESMVTPTEKTFSVTVAPPPPAPVEKAPIFSHLNSSAPALSSLSPAAPTLSHRSATTPPKRLTFANNLSVYDTFSPAMYDRRSEPATWSRLTPALAQRIKEELNSYKMEEMEVHAASRIHTQFFV